MLSVTPHFIGTYTKNLLMDWEAISQFIANDTLWIKDQLQSTERITLLTNQQIDDALNGPFQLFYRSHLCAFAAIAKLDVALNFEKEDTFKETENVAEISFDIPKHMLDSIEFSTLQGLRDNLDTLTKEHHEQWIAQIKNWTESLLSEIQQNKIILSDGEIQEFSTNQPISEINDRFVEFKIPFPKLKELDANFQQYFILKSTLAIHSALSRAQQPHGEKEIDAAIKNLKAVLKNIAETEAGLVEMQQKAIDELLIPVTIDSNN